MPDTRLPTQPPRITPAVLARLQLVNQRTTVVGVDTETATRWDAGADGRLAPTAQQTQIVGADTVTLSHWAAPGARPVYAPRPVNVIPPAPSPRPVPPMPRPVPPMPYTPPTPPAPMVDPRTARMREDVDGYLSNRDVRNGAGIVHLLKTAPAYAEAATAEQKARMVTYAVAGSASTEERQTALAILSSAQGRGELGCLVNAMGPEAMKDLMHGLGDNREGRAMAKLMMAEGLYANPAVYRAMDDDAAVALVESLGYSHPMIGTNDALRALPEAAKHRMIRELTDGNATHTEVRMANWINRHCEIPARMQ